MRNLFRLAAICVTALLFTSAVPSTTEDRLQQYRNLGKAFYENPTTSKEAVAEFKKALDLAPKSTREKLNYALALLHAGSPEPATKLLLEVQKLDPRLPHTWFNLGVYYRKAGQSAPAIEQFEAMLRLTPDEPVVHYQLGALYRQEGRTQDSIARFEQAVKLNPLLAAAHFQLYTLYRQGGRAADAAAQLKLFQDLKKQQETSATPEDVDWCNYAEIYDPPRSVTPPAAVQPVYSDRTLLGTTDASGLLALDATGKGQTDLLVWSPAGVSLFLRGTTPSPDSGLGSLKAIVNIAQGDFDNDGLPDLCVLTTAGPELYRNTGGKFTALAAPLPRREFDRAVWVDYDHDYDLDLLLLGKTPALFRNQGTAGFADRTADFPFVSAQATSAYRLRVKPDTKGFDIAVFYNGREPVLYRDHLGGRYTAEPFKGQPHSQSEIEADFDADGRPDKARIAGKAVHFLHNDTKTGSNWIRVQLAGVKSLKLGHDAEVEVKAGTLYRKQFYDGTPLTFDIGGYPQADVVRITWMNGLLQSEVRLAANKTHRIEEAQRLSGSCPMIWTWNGKNFEFITDVLGVAPLGASDGEGTYFPVDHDEFVLIPGSKLQPRDGAYEIRITEELAEVSYLDQLTLEAIDHPATTEVFTNEKFKAPPFPEDRLFEVSHRIAPTTRKDSAGALELDFAKAAPNGTATLFLAGWVDWPDGSTFRARSQQKPFEFPRLEMQDAQGRWQVVNPDMGMPAGKPKTIAVDLKFISSSRKLRIATDLPVHWQTVFLAENTAATNVLRHSLRTETADLHFRGFSEARIDPRRTEPDTYVYRLAGTAPFWNPTPGNYTRFGDVMELTTQIDDRMVVMGSGDELTLRFNANQLPPLKPGWVRDFRLKVDGWAKDQDANTAHALTVGPLPFHGMSVYPYSKAEHFPNDEVHERYQREYNTRRALRPLRPLSE
ncbi:MAG: Tetratricopeptide 2 repeat protein [Bryobacterales bacterium]|nr:Tetratricopeptide 2 repeat protein [Bryobacterales bacterium]